MLTKEYGVFGDYGYTSEELLYESDSLSDAIAWARQYIRWDNFGGYSVIEVASFSADGEYCVEDAYSAPEYA